MKIRNVRAWVASNYEPFSLPLASSFRGTRDMCPWDCLQAYLVQEYGLKKAKNIYSRMYLREDEWNQFQTQMIRWIKRLQPGISKIGLEISLAVYNMTYAPYTFGQNPKWSKKQTAYLKKEK